MTENRPLACIILAAGQGTRMKSKRPKALHHLAGRPLISWLIESAEKLEPEKIIVVTSPDADELTKTVSPHQTAIQEKPFGTGDAVKAAMPLLEGFSGDVLILLGDMPLISPATMQDLIKARYKTSATALSVLGAEFDIPPAFGRLVLGPDSALAKIIEDRDCNADEKSINLCNLGAFCIDGARLPEWLSKLKTDNAQAEYYLTDLVEIAAHDDLEAHVHVTRDHAEIHGVNDRIDLAKLERTLQNRLRENAMKQGVTLIDPKSVYFSYDTVIGQDVLIEPNVFFGPGVEIEDNVTIHAFSHIEGAKIEHDCNIGPYARIRPKSLLKSNVTIGNFIEVNRSTIGKGAKAKHVTYLGDTSIDEQANIGAGTIVANYDGYEKHKTNIGKKAFIGSNATIVAPVNIGDGAIVAAGSTITYDVPKDALAIARVEGDVRPGWALERRKKKAS